MDKITFEDWFDMFVRFCRTSAYNETIEPGQFKIKYDSGEDPHDCAREFLKVVQLAP